MRYLVISDIHANLEALDAVLRAAPSHEAVLMLGDLVGYGADPNAVIDRVRSLQHLTCIRGNHDKVGADLESTEGFNYLARCAITWTTETLTPDNREWLAGLTQGPTLVDDVVEICHGAPFDEDVYIFDDLDAVRALRSLERPICLFGHTHVPAAFCLADELRHLGPAKNGALGVSLELGSGTQYLINCGAVGQPRDGDPRAAFGLLDTATQRFEGLRVTYDVGAAQAKILAAGLPDVLAQRLARGR
jgi:diadenosine tetraphosphatase ApaH/serine/threonine PP2A family protein phosphatase